MQMSLFRVYAFHTKRNAHAFRFSIEIKLKNCIQKLTFFFWLSNFLFKQD